MKYILSVRILFLFFIILGLALIVWKKFPFINQGANITYATISQNELKLLADTCSGVRKDDRQCWNSLFEKTLATHGVDGALSLVAYAYQTTSVIGESTCHDITHFIGRQAYKLFAKGKEFPISPKTSYCNYGFFHGVIEGMTELKKPMSEAKKFCEYIDRAISKEAPEALFQCYHGIGHGVVNSHDPRTWGNEEAMLTPALKICDEISGNVEERWRCGSGVFHGLGKFYREGTYSLKLRTSDPFWVCRGLSRDEYRQTCYRELVYSLGQITNGDAVATVKLIDSIPEDSYAQETMRSYSVPIKEGPNGGAYGASFCRKVPKRLYGSCIESITRQLIQEGKPGNELVGARDFCQRSDLTVEERASCLDFLFYWNSRWYPKEKATEFCNTVSVDYRTLCLETIEKVIKDNPKE